MYNLLLYAAAAAGAALATPVAGTAVAALLVLRCGVCTAGFWVALASSGCLCGALAFCLCRRAESKPIIFRSAGGDTPGTPLGKSHVAAEAAAEAIELQPMHHHEQQQEEQQMLLARTQFIAAAFSNSSNSSMKLSGSLLQGIGQPKREGQQQEQRCCCCRDNPFASLYF
ncbi:hypothetical protein Emed_005448 [Eimeria media]